MCAAVTGRKRYNRMTVGESEYPLGGISDTVPDRHPDQEPQRGSWPDTCRQPRQKAYAELMRQLLSGFKILSTTKS